MDEGTIKSWARTLGKKAAVNSPAPTPNGSHGGETIVYPNHFNISQVDPPILASLAEQVGVAIRFSAVIIRVAKFAFLLATLYLTVSEMASDYNKALVSQVVLLSLILKLPLLCIGDFNITPNSLKNQGG